MDEFERTLAELELIFTDPELEAALTSVKELNEIIAADPASILDGTLLIEELNDNWTEKEFKGKTMFATGQMYVGGRYRDIEDVSNSDMTKNDVVNMMFTSHGFSLLNVMKQNGDEIVIEQQIVMRGRTEVGDKKGIGGITNVECGVILDPQTVIECKEMTPAKVAAWLDTYHPDVKQAIDNRIMESENESDLTLLLQDIELPIAGTNKKEIKQQKQYIESYLQSAAVFEKNVPYLTELLGDCQVLNPDKGKFEDTTITSLSKTMFLISNLFLKKSQEGTFTIHVQGSLIGVGKSDLLVANMPISTILSIESGRDLLREH
jgi:hypothetical protein